MTISGAQAFENSIALAWLEALDERNFDARTRAALAAAELERELTLAEAVQLVCAAEIVAAQHGEAEAHLPEELRKLLVLSRRPHDRDLLLARSGVARVGEASALRAAQEERGDLERWLTALRGLVARLRD